jgi:hypothetical protein
MNDEFWVQIQNLLALDHFEEAVEEDEEFHDTAGK